MKKKQVKDIIGLICWTLFFAFVYMACYLQTAKIKESDTILKEVYCVSASYETQYGTKGSTRTLITLEMDDGNSYSISATMTRKNNYSAPKVCDMCLHKPLTIRYERQKHFFSASYNIVELVVDGNSIVSLDFINNIKSKDRRILNIVMVIFILPVVVFGDCCFIHSLLPPKYNTEWKRKKKKKQKEKERKKREEEKERRAEEKRRKREEK